MTNWLRLPVLARYTRIWTGRNTALERDRNGALYITTGRDHSTRAPITETEARVLAAYLIRETSPHKPAAG